jgi:hypothetical protein
MKRTLLAAAAALAVSGGAALAAQPGAANDPSPMASAAGQTTDPVPQAIPGQPGYVTEYSAFPQGAPLGEYTVHGEHGAIGEFAPSDAPG